MAAPTPEPINKTPAMADSKDTAGSPPVLGNAVVAVPEPPVAVGVALVVDVGLAVDVVVAVGMATASSPVRLSSRPRTSPRSSYLRSSLLGLSSKPRSPP